MIFENQEQLDACLHYWQKVLRLQDWIIKATLTRRRDIDKESDGHCDAYLCRKAANICIVTAESYGDDNFQELDQEHILVHELVHIYEFPIMAQLNDDDAKEATFHQREQLVDCLATALIALNRK